jgi:hypothetical protein
MKNYYLTLTCMLLLFVKHADAQQSKAHSKINKVLAESFVYNHGIFDDERYKNVGFTFGVAVCINAQGRVDSVIFSNRTKTLDSLVMFKRVSDQLKSDKTTFLSHKNSVLVSLVLLRRSWDESISNFADRSQREWNPDRTNFDDYFNKAMPDIGSLSEKRKVKLLPTFSLVQGKPIK